MDPDDISLAGGFPLRGATDYDAIPYLSLPITYTQPASLAALAALHGVTTPHVERARVLELGCANGGNIIPLAARFPDAQFTGIDISKRQIDSGRQRIAALGLRNIELRQAAIEDVDPASHACDYLICHGVYSWVPSSVQTRILELCGRCLTRTGIATISYNVLPGWHLRLPLREMLLANAGSGSPQERIARTRELLKELSLSLTGSNAYGQLIRREADEMSRMPSSYLLGEFLAESNRPCTFSAFAEASKKAGLTYICETDLSAGTRDQLTSTARRALNDLGSKDRRRAEQKLDDFSGRPFRRSLLLRSEDADAISAPKSTRLDGLHLSARVTEVVQSGETATFRFGRNRTLRTKNAAVSRILATLTEAYPGTIPVSELLSSTADSTNIAAGLLRLVSEGLAAVFTLPVAVASPATLYPKVWHFARFEAANMQPYVTSMRHIAVHLPKWAMPLVARMDGHTSRHELVKFVLDATRTRSISVPDDLNAEQAVMETIEHLARCGVLERN